MANEQNLKPWPKGVSGNPKGRPPKVRLTAAYLESLLQVNPDDKKGRTYLQCKIDRDLLRATQGDTRTAKEIRLLVEGRIPKRK
jgi:hypothetical protein